MAVLVKHSILVQKANKQWEDLIYVLGDSDGIFVSLIIFQLIHLYLHLQLFCCFWELFMLFNL